MRRFHSYGPVDCRYHFCVDRQTLVERCIDQLVGIPDQGGHYFTIWAPRQTGKTWLMRQMREEIPQRYGDQFTLFDFSLGFTRVTMAVFVPIEDETVLEKLSVTETVDDVTVQVVAIGWI